MRNLLTAAVPLLCCSLAPTLAAQQTLLVGPGQTFATIQAAINAAASGDTVLVVGGSHAGPFDIDKPLQLVGAGGTIQGTGLTGFQVHDLAAGEAVVIRGFHLNNSTVSPILIENCAGPVTVHDVGNPGGLTGWAVVILNSAQVHVARVRINTATVTESAVAFEQCQFEPPATFLPTLNATASSVSLVQCTMRGSFTIGTSALQLTSSSALITRSSLLGTSTSFSSQPAIAATADSVLLIDPSTSLSTQGGGPTVVGTTPAFVEFGSLRASSTGSALTAEAHGPGGQIFATYFSALAPAVATPFGITWLDLGTLAPLYIGILDPTTRLHLATIPHAPQPPGLALGLQTVGLDANGIVLGQPTVVTFP
ncbi:MAG: hypothetical protein JNL08_03945 [Planctomycetes bacterium]|nr:hypothetical protein [Planctomycetota bacterium]